MRFTIVQDLPFSVTAYFDLLEQDELEDRVTASSSSHREPLGSRWDGPVLERRTRIRPRRELPAVIARLLGPDGLSYTQTTHTDRPAGEHRWRIRVDRAGDRVHIAGVERPASTPTGCRVTISTDVEVRVPLLASRVERAVEAEIRRVYGRRDGLMRELAGQG
jgi:hypothetical protein